MILSMKVKVVDRFFADKDPVKNFHQEANLPLFD